jgi:hypothetical protein
VDVLLPSAAVTLVERFCSLARYRATMPDLTPLPERGNEHAKDGAAKGAEIGATLGSPLGPAGGAVGAGVGGATGYLAGSARDTVEKFCPF